MVYNIISDIHEDYCSLEKVLKSLNGNDKKICLGDIVGFCLPYNSNFENTRSSNKCISLLEKYSFKSVIGNHDLNVLKRIPNISKFKFPNNWYDLSIEDKEKLSGGVVYLYRNELDSNLSAKSKKHLSNLPEYFIENQILCTHFLYPNITGSAKFHNDKRGVIDIISHFKFMEKYKVKTAFIGHKHVNQIIIINSKNRIVKLDENIEYKLDAQSYNIILCPAIVRYKNLGCSFVIYDNEKSVVKWQKIT